MTGMDGNESQGNPCSQGTLMMMMMMMISTKLVISFYSFKIYNIWLLK